jgi:hypothetical protein
MSSSSETSSSSEKESIVASNHHTSLHFQGRLGRKAAPLLRTATRWGGLPGPEWSMTGLGRWASRHFLGYVVSPGIKTVDRTSKPKQLEWKLKKWNLKNQILLRLAFFKNCNLVWISFFTQF